MKPSNTFARLPMQTPEAFGRGVGVWAGRLWQPLLGLAGVAALAVLVISAGIGQVAEAMARIGWLVVPLACLHVVPLLLDASAWRMLTPPPRPGLIVFVAARRVREGVNALLPVAQIGGEIVAVRMLTRAGAGAAESGALVAIDLATEFVSMMLVGGLGLLVLMALASPTEHAEAMLIAGAMVPGALVALAFLLVQRIGLLGRLAGRVMRRWPKLAAQFYKAQEAATAAWARPGALLGAIAFHALGWGAGAVETWIVLAALGHPIGLEQAFALETTSEVLRSFGFAVPGLLAVQEGSLVLVGGLLGVPALEAIALSLFRRARDVALGVPALLIWQAAESYGERGSKRHR